jgi:hypothetical protein
VEKLKRHEQKVIVIVDFFLSFVKSYITRSNALKIIKVIFAFSLSILIKMLGSKYFKCRMSYDLAASQGGKCCLSSLM